MTCIMDKQVTWENIYPQHIVAFIYSGSLTISYGTSSLTFKAGDTILVPKNQLSRSIKRPLTGEPFKCVSLVLPEERLRKFYRIHPILNTWTDNISKQRPLKSHPLLEGFFTSLLPYFDMQDELPDDLAAIKVQELLTIINDVDKRASALLGTFDQASKIDLEEFMEEHFMYNLPLERFAFLTGRSLSSFKTDFKKLFDLSPGKWLTQKRLKLAHHKLTSEKLKASDVYLSVGFENLSHFSYAFKKAFGYNPSEAKDINSSVKLKSRK